MEAVSGGSAAAASASSSSTDPPRPQHSEQKRSSNRTPSPARPRGGHSRLSTGCKPGVPSKPGASKAGLSPARLSRRSPAKDKLKHGADAGGSSSKPGATSSSSSTSSMSSSCSSGGAPRATKSFLIRLSSAEQKAKKIDCKAAAAAAAVVAAGGGGAAVAVRLRRKATGSSLISEVVLPAGSRTPNTDSSSDLSDCISEPLSVSDEQGGGGGREAQLFPSISDKQLDDLRESAEDGDGGEEAIKADDADDAAATTAAAVADSAAAAVAAAGADSAGKSDAADCSDSGMEAESADSPSELRAALRADEEASGDAADSCSSAADARSSRHGEMCGLEDELGFLDQEIFREMEDLRSENTYLKDELEELRTEMEEMRDSYLEEDAQHVQDLRRELDRAHKSCRILQYRLRKAERRSLRAIAAAHSGHSDGELIRAFEQDLKVAKDVSVRLHRELESVEDRRVRAEDENDTLRAKLIQLEVAKQALQNEMDKMKESSLRRRGSRELYKSEKRTLSQEDNADLKCQLQFLKEEAALMRRKMVRVGKERDRFEQELQKYKASYGDLDGPLTAAETSSVPGGGPPSTRETELKLRLRLVEEEATILSRKIMELEVENGGLRSEMEEMKCHCEKGGAMGEGSDADDHRSCVSVDGELGESACELRRHLQFVEEEAEVLRRSVVELEEQNRLLTEELGRTQSGSNPEGDWEEEMSESGPLSSESLQEELDNARSKIRELSGKLAKFQYENRILLSKAQSNDLFSQASHKESTDDSLEDLGEFSQMRREGPVGGEGEIEDHREGTTNSQMENDMSLLLRRYEEPQKLAHFRSEAERLGKVIESLISDTDSLISDARVAMPCGALDNNEEDASSPDSGPQLLDRIDARMKDIGKELKSFIEKLDISAVDEDNTCTRDNFSHFTLNRDHTLDFQSELEDQPSWDEHSVDKACNLTPPDKTSSGALHERIYGKTDSVESELRESQEVLSEANMTIQQLQVQLEQERQYRREENQHLEKQISMLKVDQRKLALRRDFELQSMRLQQKLERRELARARGSLMQEVRCLRQGLALVCARLRAVVRHWRQGRKDLGLGDEAFLDMDGAADLSLVLAEKDLLEDLSEASNASESTEDSGVHSLLEGLTEKRDSLAAMECLGKWEQQGRESRRVLLELRSVLEDLQSEFREEERSRSELQRQFATEKATWEVERAQFKFVLSQLQVDVSSSGEEAPLPEQLAEQQKALLADMHGRTLELRRQLHAGERGWGRERTELLQRFDHERKDWEQQLRLMRHKVQQLQKEKSSYAGSGLAQHIPEVSADLRSEQGKIISLLRGGSDSQMLKDMRPRAFESLVLDALSLDSPNHEALHKAPLLGQSEVKLFRRTNSEDLGEDTEGKTGLRRARSSSSINEFDAQTDSTPYLPEKTSPTNSDPLFIKIDGVSHPLSPDDLKYIEEFAARRRDNDGTHDRRWSSDGQESERGLLQDIPTESEGHSSWYLTTSVNISGSVLIDTELRAQQIMGFGPEEADRDREEYYGRRSARGSDAAQPDGDAVDGGYSFLSPHRRRTVDSRWSSELLGRRSDSSESGIASDIQTSSAAEAEASHNLSDDMKEAAFGMRPGTSGDGGADDDRGGRCTHDAASQTGSSSTTGTQTVRTMVNVCAQTEYVRGLSSHRAAVLHRATSPAVLGSPRPALGARSKSSVMAAAASSSSSQLEKIDARFERNCCSKFSSPRFPRKAVVATAAPVSRAEQPRYGRDSPLSRLDSLKGQSESAWARSTTTRDSPVHTTSNHGLSSLFTFIDHSTEVPSKAGAKPGGKEAVRSRSVDMSRSNYGLIQEILKNARDRSLSPNSSREQRLCPTIAKSCFGSPKKEVQVISSPRARDTLSQMNNEPATAKSSDQDDAGENSTDKPAGNTPESPSQSRESAAATLVGQIRRFQKNTTRTFQPRWPPRDSPSPSPSSSSKKSRPSAAEAPYKKPSADEGEKRFGAGGHGIGRDVQGELKGGECCSQSCPQEAEEAADETKPPESIENGSWVDTTEDEAPTSNAEDTSMHVTVEIDQLDAPDVEDNLGDEDKDLRAVSDNDKEEDSSGISADVCVEKNVHSGDDYDYNSADKPESNNESLAQDEEEISTPDVECADSMPDDEQTIDDPAEKLEFNTIVANEESPTEDKETHEPDDGGDGLQSDLDDIEDLNKVEEPEEKENDSEESELDQLVGENSEDGNDPTA